ncbi:MAG: flagellar biosynthesis protein FlhA [Planctomycetota bacterium]
MANNQTAGRVADGISRNLDLILIFGVLGILVTIFVPLPTLIVDFLLVANICVSLLILFTCLYVKEPLQFSVFPSVLLITTSYRMALNIATTRLILGNTAGGDLKAAGQVIFTFGDFVAGQDTVIGLVIFIILMIVQFVVITKGTSRISEVAARFTLDAMPGKQMAIDADLNAGLIKETDARNRREQITREADFYGAMDGATKFVRGDAIAGIIIVIVNIIGGFIVGYAKYSLPIEQSFRTYTLLAVGDGLVTQIPALLVSLASGLIVSRATAQTNLGKEFFGQVFSVPRAMFVAAAFLVFLVLATPLPMFQMLVVGGLVAAIGWQLKRGVEEAAVKEAAKKEPPRKPEKVEALLHVDPMEIEVGYGLIRMVDPAQGGDLLERVTMIRRQMAVELGVVIPPIRIRDNMQLSPNQYVIKVRGTTIAQGTLVADQFLAMDSGGAAGKLEGTKTKEPAFGLPATWVPESQRQRAEALGYTVVDPTSVLATHLTEVIKSHAAEILTRDDVHTLLTTLKETSKQLVEEVVPALLKPGDLQKVLQGLLREGVSVRDLGSILETLGDYAQRTKDIEVLTEYARAALSRTITAQHLSKDGKLWVITLDPKLEDLVKSGVERTESGSYLSLSPKLIQRVVEKVGKELEKLVTAGHPAVVLCSPQIRLAMKRIADTMQPGIAVLSYNEVTKDAKVESVGMAALD